jgi:hypothetical protein
MPPGLPIQANFGGTCTARSSWSRRQAIKLEGCVAMTSVPNSLFDGSDERHAYKRDKNKNSNRRLNPSPPRAHNRKTVSTGRNWQIQPRISQHAAEPASRRRPLVSYGENRRQLQYSPCCTTVKHGRTNIHVLQKVLWTVPKYHNSQSRIVVPRSMVDPFRCRRRARRRSAVPSPPPRR